MTFTQEQVKHVANLSRLQIDEGDLGNYQKELGAIVEYADILNKIPQEEIESIRDDDMRILPLRTDDVKTGEFCTREELLDCSPKKKVNHSLAIGNIMGE